MGKMMVKKVGCDDVWMVEDGYVIEGILNNVYFVKGNKIVMCGLLNDIFYGIICVVVLWFVVEV